MPPHIAILDVDGNPADTFAVSISGGNESALIVREIWNDKTEAFLDTTTAASHVLKMLASSSGGPYKSSGVPALDELWSRVTVLAYLSTEDAGETVIEDTAGTTGTHPIGTNSEIPIRDLAPQEGLRVSIRIVVPGGATADALKLKLRAIGNRASSPLAQHVSLATGGGVIPADRMPTTRAILSGSIITADDTDTITVTGGQHVYDGTIATELDAEIAFTLADSNAVNLGAGESYRVTISREPDGDAVATKGPKGAATYPAKPLANIFVGNLTVSSADGVAVTVAPASVIQTALTYAGLHARAGAGLTLLLSAGDSVSTTDARQYVSHEIPINLTASSTNRVWLLPDGTALATVTDAAPMIGAEVIYLATTDAANVTLITDMRVLLHRGLTMRPLEFAPITDAFSQLVTPAYGVAMVIADEAYEIERVSANLTDVDETWTAGAIVADIYAFAPGTAVPFPAGAAGGTSIFAGWDAADLPLRIAFDAESLMVETVMHTTRRIAKGTRLLLAIMDTPDAPGPEVEQQLRVALHVRRYR